LRVKARSVSANGAKPTQHKLLKGCLVVIMLKSAEAINGYWHATVCGVENARHEKLLSKSAKVSRKHATAKSEVANGINIIAIHNKKRANVGDPWCYFQRIRSSH
jgi:hypothetical protein